MNGRRMRVAIADLAALEVYSSIRRGCLQLKELSL
jgi:hypothetical protein